MWTKQRNTVFLDRYARKDERGELLEHDPEQMWDRVASAIASDGTDTANFRHLLDNFKFVPGGRILSGAGTEKEVTFYNCFVIPVRNETKPENGNDSRESIFDTISRMVGIMSRGGGVGINWSTLRPTGAYLSRINGTTSGPLVWMDVASRAVGAVEQGGSRRGAAMFMLNDWHPDLEAFIDSKRDLSKITNANISIAVSDAFMHAVENDLEWILRFPDTTDTHYNEEWDGDFDSWERKGYNYKIYKTVKAKDIWRKLAEAAWDNGEPGVIFLERYNKLSTAADIEKIISVNPCGEQGLGAYSVCNLGAINLDKYVENQKFDWVGFQMDVGTAVRFLDNVIDKNNYADFTETYERQMQIRRIGLSVMGLADALIHLGFRYGSKDAVDFTSDVFKAMKLQAIEASAALAAEKGAAPGWKKEYIKRPYLKKLPEYLRLDVEKHGLRNLFLLTQAPTGTTSILAGVNSGIEPYFAFRYNRSDRTGTWGYTAPVVSEWESNHGGEKLPDHYVTANEVSVEEHVAMQAAAQKWIDSSVSKTLNAPNSHTVEDVEKAYTLAYSSGLKSIAYFRDGCGRAQVLNNVDAKKDTVEVAHTNGHGNGKFSRPTALTGITNRVSTGMGTAFITVNYNEENKPVEVFVNIGKAGTDLNELSEAIGRLISISLQKGVPASTIAEQMLGIGGYSKLFRSLPTAIATTLRDALVAAPVVPAETPLPDSARVSEMCPNCQSFSLVHAEGCIMCPVCAYSAC